eukprot:SAG31_NODE_451_length_15511_cov_77.547301_10_plen_118_part_00
MDIRKLGKLVQRAPGRAPVSDPCGIAGAYEEATGGGGQVRSSCMCNDCVTKCCRAPNSVQTKFLAIARPAQSHTLTPLVQTPIGSKQGDKGSELPVGVITNWKAGGVEEVGFMLGAK